jgi:hypothetical protein
MRLASGRATRVVASAVAVVVVVVVVVMVVARLWIGLLWAPPWMKMMRLPPPLPSPSP